MINRYIAVARVVCFQEAELGQNNVFANCKLFSKLKLASVTVGTVSIIRLNWFEYNNVEIYRH